MITRELINKNIKLHDLVVLSDDDVTLRTYTYQDLSDKIDRFKTFLVSKNVKAYQNAKVCSPVTTDSTALVFALAELGLNITIIDVPFNHDGSLSDKCKLLFPIDILISTSRQYSLQDKKMLKLQSYASKTLILENQHELSKYSSKIECNDDSIFLRCTTSGTTDTPKVITHTHGFFTELIKRNSSMYYGNMALIANLNHGSSPATYFLPGLVSENVTNFFHIPYKLDNGTDRLVKTLEKLKSLGHDIQHIMFPYTHKIDEFLNSNHTFEHCNIYTLSYIKKDWIKYINDKKIKDVVSIFGTNETSGPLMLNYGSDTNFSETSYKAIDNFYKLEINSKNELEVNIPIYNRVVNTKDKFSFENNNYTHLGRSNFYRINDLELDLDMYNSICQSYLNGEFIIDNANNSIYLLLNDEKFDIVKITDLNSHIKKISNNLHFICKYGYIRKLEFMTGIKLDRQLIRAHFRNMVSQNTLL